MPLHHFRRHATIALLGLLCGLGLVVSMQALIMALTL